jgi:hypothetical protein
MRQKTCSFELVSSIVVEYHVGVVKLHQDRTPSNQDATSRGPTSFLGLGQILVLSDCVCSDMKILVRLLPCVFMWKCKVGGKFNQIKANITSNEFNAPSENSHIRLVHICGICNKWITSVNFRVIARRHWHIRSDRIKFDTVFLKIDLHNGNGID